MALGTGSALAHRAVDSVLGSRHPEPAEAQAAAQQIAAQPQEPCAPFAKTFADCMSDSDGQLEACRYYFDKLQVLPLSFIPRILPSRCHSKLCCLAIACLCRSVQSVMTGLCGC
jgi:hypothetical protein